MKPVIQDIREALERESIAEKASGWNVILFPTAAIRRMLVIGIGTAVAQQAVGIDAIQYYLIDVLERSGIKSEKGRIEILILLGVLKLIFIMIGGKLFDRRGRRPLILVSLSGKSFHGHYTTILSVAFASNYNVCFLQSEGMTLALCLISFTFFGGGQSKSGFAVFGLALYMSFFSIGMGPGAWLIPSEIFATSIRAKSMSVATFWNRITATLMASTFLSTSKAITWAGFFLMLAGVCIIVAAFIYVYLPETKGRSLEDMSIYFAEITGDQSLLDAEAKIIQKRQGKASSNIEMMSALEDPEGTMT